MDDEFAATHTSRLEARDDIAVQFHHMQPFAFREQGQRECT